MKSISMLDLRLHSEKIIAQVRQGQRMILTYRGKPVARLEPIVPTIVDGDDPFYSLDALGESSGKSLSNAEIDEIVYGE